MMQNPANQRSNNEATVWIEPRQWSSDSDWTQRQRL